WHPVLWSPGQRQMTDFALTMGRTYEAFTDADFAALLAKYPADYVLASSESPRLAMPLVFDGKFYRLYRARTR
ncbi:MAG TPA: hypothetical protein VNI01_10865, partial [Elusimicrobiota bacterium]|nr:hypothetical protein [Elusimicrobiota bacterium]